MKLFVFNQFWKIIFIFKIALTKKKTKDEKLQNEPILLFLLNNLKSIVKIPKADILMSTF